MNGRLATAYYISFLIANLCNTHAICVQLTCEMERRKKNDVSSSNYAKCKSPGQDSTILCSSRARKHVHTSSKYYIYIIIICLYKLYVL